MKKTKICFVAIYAYKLFDKSCKIMYGGAEVDLYLLAKEYAKDDRFEVYFAVGDFGQKKEQVIDGVHVVRTCYKVRKSYKDIGGLLMMFRFVNDLIRIKPDIFVQEVAGMMTVLTALGALLSRKKFVYRTASVIDCGWWLKENGGIFGRLYYWGLKQAALVICQSGDQQKMLEDNFRIKAPIIRNAHSIPTISGSDKKGMLWVARCESLKRPEIFFEIANKFPDVGHVMICPKLENHEDFFKEISEKAEDVKNVRFIERVPFDEIQTYYNHSKVFICTSDSEGFPNTYIQACIGKTPIVSLNINPDNFINNNSLGYCADGDFDRMVGHIKKLLDDKNDWEEKSENACRYAKENHDMRKIKGQWDEALLGLINIK